MRIKRLKRQDRLRRGALLRRFLFVALVVLGVNVWAVQPASADTQRPWKPWTYSSAWHCSQTSAAGDTVAFSACTIVNGNYTQAALVATNNATVETWVSAPQVRLYQDGALRYTDSCVSELFPRGRSAACFGTTVSRPCNSYVQGYGWGRVLQPNVATERYGFGPTRRMCTS